MGKVRIILMKSHKHRPYFLRRAVSVALCTLMLSSNATGALAMEPTIPETETAQETTEAPAETTEAPIEPAQQTEEANEPTEDASLPSPPLPPHMA